MYLDIDRSGLFKVRYDEVVIMYLRRFRVRRILTAYALFYTEEQLITALLLLICPSFSTL